jgi:hypothetical protein
LQSSTGYAAERLELANVLTSGVLGRSPTLAQLLIYLTARYFDGTADSIKEYSIAIDVFNRPQSFDPKKDSFVRVQVHRLRERLTEYYRNEGRDNTLHIVIPSGTYVPEFSGANLTELAAAAVVPAIEEVPVESPTEPEPKEPPALEQPVLDIPVEAPPKRVRTSKVFWMMGIAGILIGAGVVLAIRSPWSSGSSRQEALPVAVVSNEPPIRIMAGLPGSNWTDGSGKEWGSDRFFSGGTIASARSIFINGTHDQRLYQTRREGDFQYDIPLPPGVYELRLYFAEVFHGENGMTGNGGENSRVFGISANGTPLLPALDVTADVGGQTADVRMFRDISPAQDGKLHLAFVRKVGVPFVNAIEIAPGTPHKMRPLLLTERNTTFVDRSGNRWEPDRIVIGGRQVTVSGLQDDDPEDELYGGGRYGRMTWAIPVPHASLCTITLYARETWMGPDRAGGGGVGSRVFDIFANGIALARDFDIYKRAGESHHPVTVSFRHISADHQDKIRLFLIPHVNYPALSALRVDEE